MNKTNKGVIEKINTGYRKYSPNFYPNDILDDRLLGIEMKINEIINFLNTNQTKANKKWK